jgi:dTDP-4-dehydrorhamnose reductase
MRIIIFGISGLIGNSLFTYLSKDNNLKVYGTSRRNINFIQDNILYFEWSSKNRIKNLNSIINKCKPDLVINCIGITKHHQKKNKSDYINLNSNLPHEIARVSNELNAKFLQISTDCVFSGKLGNYDELAICDSKEIYGISKFNGEIIDNFNLTIRISTLGREIGTKNGLLEWFLNQEKRCFGYKSAFFSGITTYELSQIIINYIIPNINKLNGLYHISGEKINKFLLLNKLSKVYNKKIKIIPTTDLKIDRSLNSEKFQDITGYTKKNWDEMLSKNYI